MIVPGPGKVAYPALLDFPAPELNGYTMESTIAEKFHAMVKLGILNSRMKDFYDIWMLSRTFDFRGEILAEAVEETFENRDTPIPIKPTVFNPSFVNDNAKKIQWQGFIRKAKLSDASEVMILSQQSMCSSTLSWLPREGHSASFGMMWPDVYRYESAWKIICPIMLSSFWGQ